jgi:DHA2 family multidrug resistance protein-like MFS transporter
MAPPVIQSDGLPIPRRYWATAAIWLAMSMSVLDASIANIALPTIARDLGADPVSAIWVVNAYQIAITMTLLTVASLGDTLGYKRVYMVGLTLFVAASLCCAMSHNLPTLAAARFAQGLGAAGIMGVNGALVRFTWPRAKLGRGVGYNALVVAIAAAAGPSIAAAILAWASWQWLFAVNVPLGLISLAIGSRCLPVIATSGGRLDAISAMLCAATFGPFFLGVADFVHGGTETRATIELAVGLAAGFLLVRREWGRPKPLFPLDLVRIPLLRLSYMTSITAFAAQMGSLISLPFYLQGRFGFTHVETGLLITPMPLGIALAAPFSGRLVERYPAGLLGGIGLVILAAGASLLAVLPDHPAAAIVGLGTALIGFGFGIFQTPNNRTLLGTAPPERSGAAGGMQATARLVGQTSGAVLVALMFRMTGSASRASLLMAALLAGVATVFSLRRLSAASVPNGAGSALPRNG